MREALANKIRGYTNEVYLRRIIGNQGVGNLQRQFQSFARHTLPQHLMAQTFSQDDFVELSYSQLVQDHSLRTYKIPEWFGEGHFQEIELFPGLELAIFDNEYCDDVVVKIPVRDHPIEPS